MGSKNIFLVTNKLNQRIKLGDIIFGANETKELNEKPYSDKFIVEEIKDVYQVSTSGRLKIEKIKPEKKPTKLKENKE